MIATLQTVILSLVLRENNFLLPSKGRLNIQSAWEAIFRRIFKLKITEVTK
jgi:hypothetical protein